MLRFGRRRSLVLCWVVLLASPALAQEAKLPWKTDLNQGLAEARQAKKRVFVDFTGSKTCVNCIRNEKTVFTRPDVQELLKKYVLVKLDTEAPEEALQSANNALYKQFNVEGLPTYIFLEPTETGYKELERASGLIPREKIEDFQALLKKHVSGTAAPVKPVRPKKTAAEVIDWVIELRPSKVDRNQVVTIVLKGTPKPGWHTYPITKRTDKQPEGQLTTLKVEAEDKGLRPLWPIRESEPERVNAVGIGEILEHKKPFTWEQDVLATPEATTGVKKLKLVVVAQLCDEEICLPPEQFEFPLTVEVTDAARPLEDSIKNRLNLSQPAVQIVPASGPGGTAGPSGSGGTRAPSASPPSSQKSAGLLPFIGTGIFWGAVSLFTPCVFPMIPITVSFFLKKSEQENARPLLHATVYSFTIVLVLTISAVALLSTFREWINAPWMNLLLGGLFVFFALSLFGMYDIELPSGLARFTSSREGQGVGGTIFMALTFTIISFACVAPFLGGFGGTAVKKDLPTSYIVLGSLGFSVTFASPFVVLALFPALLKKMPKSGTWLNSVKVVMGYLELAAAFKFLRSAEILSSPRTEFFTYDFVLAVYVALAFACGLYLLCFYRLPHDTPIDNLSVPRVLLAIAFISLGFHLLPALWRTGDNTTNQTPRSSVFAWLDSFLLRDEEDKPSRTFLQMQAMLEAGPGGQVAKQHWYGFLPEALNAARKSGKRIFIDFTGVNCTNCRYNEGAVFPRPEVQAQFARYELLKLYTDKVPNELYPEGERELLDSSVERQRADARKHLQLQRDSFGTEQLPLYAVIEATPDGWQHVAIYDEAKINKVGEFVEFLRKNAGQVKNGK